MRYAIVAAAAMTLAAFSAVAAEQKAVADDAFGGPAAMMTDETLSTQRAKGEGGNGGNGGNGETAGLSCMVCTANGMSTISGNAFQGASGVVTIVQNTGNQVMLQTTTVVNVSIGR